MLMREETALHYAAAVGEVKIAQLLIDAGADPQIENRDSRTTLEVNRENEVADLLRTYKSREPSGR